MKSKTNIFKHLLILFMAVMLITAAIPVAASAAGAKLNRTSITLNVKKTYQLRLTGTSKKVKWSTSNKKVATVSRKGKVTAKKRGTATIKAKVGSKSYKCKVTVKQPVTSVKLNKKSYTLKKKGATVTLKATVRPKNANNRSVKWTTSNPKVATVSGKGKVTAVGNGTCKITATAADGSKKKASCTITVKGIKSTASGSNNGTTSYSLEIKQKSIDLAIGWSDDNFLSLEIYLTTKLPNGTSYVTQLLPPDLNWTSANTGIVQVCENNHALKPIAEGHTTLTGTYKGMSVTIAVNVTKPPYTEDDLL